MGIDEARRQRSPAAIDNPGRIINFQVAADLPDKVALDQHIHSLHSLVTGTVPDTDIGD